MMLHERWFTHESAFPVQFDRWNLPESWIPVATAVGVTALAAGVWRAGGRRSPVSGPVQLGMTLENYEKLLSWVPLVIGVHMGITLLVNGITRQLFVPNLALPVNLLGGVMGLAEIAIGLSFVYGALARPAAAALGVLWVAGVILFGPIRLLEHTEVVGVAFFLFVTGRGPLAFDMAMERLHRPITRLIPYVVPALRSCTAIGIIVVAFTEKLWNLPMGMAFLAEHHFNFFPAMGMSWIDDRTFLIIAGTVELTIGLVLLSGAYVRLLILATLIPFNLTLPFLGWRELVGHLPLYGIFALLLLWGHERPPEQGTLTSALSGQPRAAS
ncbi:hypothetical protein BH11GEM1_BH11GEM1_10350 [soil metagenome]